MPTPVRHEALQDLLLVAVDGDPVGHCQALEALEARRRRGGGLLQHLDQALDDGEVVARAQAVVSIEDGEQQSVCPLRNERKEGTSRTLVESGSLIAAPVALTAVMDTQILVDSDGCRPLLGNKLGGGGGAGMVGGSEAKQVCVPTIRLPFWALSINTRGKGLGVWVGWWVGWGGPAPPPPPLRGFLKQWPGSVAGLGFRE